MKTHFLSVLMLALAMNAFAQPASRLGECWDGTVAETYAGGDGSANNPYQIATAEQLALLAYQTNSGTGGDAYYVLVDNICVNDDLNQNPRNWIPIGDTISPFTGHFDGRKMEISGLYFEDNQDNELVGLFGCTNDAEIQNVSLADCRLSGTKYVGTLVGYAGLTNFSDCHVDRASVTCEGRSAGGLVGFLGLPYGLNNNSLDTCRVENCSAGDGVSVYGMLAGGLVGEATEFLLWGYSVPTVITNCTSSAVLMGSQCVGGLVGFMRNGRVEACRCWNEVHSGQYAGGMVGYGVNVNLTGCQNGTLVKGNYHSGGMVGELDGGNLSNCENYGWIQGAGLSGISKVGGMVGRFEPEPLLAGSPCENFIRNCHNYGEITDAGNDAGGIVGHAEGAAGVEQLFIVDCSNTGYIHNSVCSGGILGSNLRFKIRLLNVYNTGNIGARYLLGGIVEELQSSSRAVNAYSVGELSHEIDNYVCPMGNIIGRSETNEQFSSCYWLANDEHSGNGQGPELANSTAFQPTSSPSVWQLLNPIHDTDDLLTALNEGAEQIENEFPALGSVSRWREDAELSNGGFPLFGHQWPLGVEENGPSVPEPVRGTFAVYPNPTNGVLFVETQNFASLQGQTYQITNLMGQTLMTSQIIAETQQINVANLPKGMYFIDIDGFVQKFVVE